MNNIEKLTPNESVKAVCRNCLGNRILTEELIKNCEGNSIGCVLYPYRFGKRVSVKILQRYCYHDCMACNMNRNYVRDCTTSDCAAHPYRFGRNPARKGMGDARNLGGNRC